MNVERKLFCVTAAIASGGEEIGEARLAGRRRGGWAKNHRKAFHGRADPGVELDRRSRIVLRRAESNRLVKAAANCYVRRERGAEAGRRR